MNRGRSAWTNLLFLLITLVFNTLGAIGLINGFTQKEISDMYVTLITPSPATFSIWSVIYTFQIISVIVMILKKDDPYYKEAIERISGLFRISCVLNIAWIVTFSFLLVEVSVAFIVGFVITLALICKVLLEISYGRHWLLPFSFGIYAGWLFIATVVNTAAALIKMKWSALSMTEERWGVIMLIVSVILVIVVISRIKNAAFPAPLAWAYFGIYQFLKSPEGFKGEFGSLQTTSLAGAAVLVLIAAIQFFRNRFSVIPDLDKKNIG